MEEAEGKGNVVVEGNDLKDNKTIERGSLADGRENKYLMRIVRGRQLKFSGHAMRTEMLENLIMTGMGRKPRKRKTKRKVQGGLVKLVVARQKRDFRATRHRKE